MKDRNVLPSCPVEVTLQLIGNKWKVLILRDLFEGTKRFSTLKKSVEGISQKVLTENLRDLEKNKIVVRKVYSEVPPKVEYSLTKLGKTLKPIIDSMYIWGEKYKNNNLEELWDYLLFLIFMGHFITWKKR